MTPARVFTWIVLITLLCVPSISCSGPTSGSPVLTAELPLHLEEHLDAATIEGSEVPEVLPQPVEWRFDEPQLDWQAPAHRNPYIPPLQIMQTEEALRISLDVTHRDPRADRLHGDIYVPLPDLKRGEWSHVLVRARTSDDIRSLVLVFNLADPTAPDADQQGMFQEAQWEAHQALAQRFTSGGEVALTSEQLETLRALGYIQ